jgi:large subunit ribosomal protein L25
MTATIEATIRTETGKGVARKLRAAGKVPAVLYGHGEEALPLTIDPKKLSYELAHAEGYHSILTLKIAGDKPQEYKVLIQDYNAQPVSDILLHVDFMALQDDKPLLRTVPLVLEGRPIGVKQGGRLSIYRREIKIKCLPENFQPAIKIDISDMKTDDTMRVQDITLPEGVEAIAKDNYAIAFVKPAKVEVAGAEEGEEAAAPEASETPAEA